MSKSSLQLLIVCLFLVAAACEDQVNSTPDGANCSGSGACIEAGETAPADAAPADTAPADTAPADGDATCPNNNGDESLVLLGTMQVGARIQSMDIADCGSERCLAVDLGGVDQEFGLLTLPQPGGDTSWVKGPLSLVQPIWATLDAEPSWRNHYVTGIAALGGGEFVTQCGHDWYLPAVDHATHCWFNIDTNDAVGGYTIGADGDTMFFAQALSKFIARVPQAYADAKLAANGELYCVSGNRRDGPGKLDPDSAKVGGPRFIFHPCTRPAFPPPGPILNATSATFYGYEQPFNAAMPESIDLRLPPHPADPSDWPHASYKDRVGDITWVDDMILMTVVHGSDLGYYKVPTTGERYRMATGMSAQTLSGTYKAHWDDVVGRDPVFSPGLGRPLPDTLPDGTPFRDLCYTDRGFSAPYEDGLYNLEIWGWDVREFFSAELPQPSLRVVLGRSCDSAGGIAFDPVSRKLYVGVHSANEEILIYDVPSPLPASPVACD